jgi:hypothetical protein
MPQGLDWEGAAKRDHIRDHGATPYWVDLPKPKSLERRPEETKTGRALVKRTYERGRVVVSQFDRLDPQKRVREIEHYRARIRDLCSDERRVVPASKRRYAPAILVAEKQLLAEIKSLARAAKSKPALGKTRHRKRDGAGTPKARSRSKQNATREIAREKKRRSKRGSVSRLPGMRAEAVAEDGKVNVRWEDIDQADGWLVVVTRKKLTGQEVINRWKLSAEARTFETAKIDLTRGPYGVRLFAYCDGKPIARAAVDGIVDPSVPLIREAPNPAQGKTKPPAKAKRKAPARSKKPQAKTKKRKTQPALAKTKICRDGPDWKPKRRCPCKKCRARAKRNASTAGVRAAMRSSGPTGRPRVTFWRGR